MTFKKQLLFWLLRNEVIDLGVGAALTLAQVTSKLKADANITIMESDGLTLKFRLVRKGGIGSVNIEGGLDDDTLKAAVSAIQNTFGTQPVVSEIPDISLAPSMPAAMAMPETPEIDPYTTKRVAAIPSAMKAIALAHKHGWALFRIKLGSSVIQFRQEQAAIDVQWHENGTYKVALTNSPQIFRDGVNEALLEKLLTKPTA